MGEWQEIALAPKDGTEVLLFYPNSGDGLIVVGRWTDDRFIKTPRPHWTHDRDRLFGKQFLRKHSPTHWMPLPAPPAEVEKG